MNNNDIKKILDDLYALDPALRSHEKELTAIISAMAIKPQAKYDAAFAANLRAQLLTELARNQQVAQENSFLNIFTARSFRYAILGVAVIAIGAIAIIGLQQKPAGSVAINSPKITITSVGANAFGTLSTPSAATPTAAVAPSAAAPMNAVAVSPAHPISPIGPVPPPADFAAVKYSYTGSPISQNQSQLDVLKKITEPLSAGAAATALEQAGFGQIDLSTFNNLTMSNVTLNENQSFGYEISIDFTDGTISINQNYNEWPQNSATTTPLTAADIPSDSAVIATADQFLASHDIATTTYGTPVVAQSDNVIVPVASAGTVSNTTNMAMPMIPYYSDAEQVLYPLVVNGMNVYDSSGNETGLTVEVNVRYNRVENVYGLQTESYQSSAYDAITDTNTILSAAETAPTYPIFYNLANGSAGTTGNISETTYDLGTPTMGYEDTYQTDSQGNSNEFLVPSFIFPVTSNASDTVIRKIVVPLIAEFDQQQQGFAIPGQAAPLNNSAAASPVAQ